MWLHFPTQVSQNSIVLFVERHDFIRGGDKLSNIIKNAGKFRLGL